MLDLTGALLSFIFASFSVIATAAYLRISYSDLDKQAARLGRASDTATAHLHDGIPYFTSERTASINTAVKAYLGIVQDVLTFLLFLRGTDKDIPRRHGVRVVTDAAGGVLRTTCVTLAIGLCSLLLVPIILLVAVCEAVHCVASVFRWAGLGRRDIAQSPERRLKVQ